MEAALAAQRRMAALNLLIIREALMERTEQSYAHSLKDFHTIVGAIVVLAEPLSATSLGNLLAVPRTQIAGTLDGLESFLDFDLSSDSRITVYHQTFRDFLLGGEDTDDGRFAAEEFHVDERQTHAMLARQCLRHLEGPDILKKDLLQVSEPGMKRAEIGQEVVARGISDSTAYACRYWVTHQSASKQGLEDNDDVHRFLQEHFLHWIEALSWLNALSGATKDLHQLKSRVLHDRSPRLIAFLDDALEFVAKNEYIANIAPLQLYQSGLIFAPPQSAIRLAFIDRYPPLLTLLCNIRNRIDRRSGRARRSSPMTR